MTNQWVTSHLSGQVMHWWRMAPHVFLHHLGFSRGFPIQLLGPLHGPEDHYTMKHIIFGICLSRHWAVIRDWDKRCYESDCAPVRTLTLSLYKSREVWQCPNISVISEINLKTSLPITYLFNSKLIYTNYKIVLFVQYCRAIIKGAVLHILKLFMQVTTVRKCGELADLASRVTASFFGDFLQIRWLCKPY